MIPTEQIGALVVGGEHPGLGVVRSLGRRGIPVYVLDDQHSVSEFSRYTTGVVKVKDLRDERKAVDAVLETGRRFNLRNWILYPTRDETVAAFSRYRPELAEFFRVPTPGWETVQWAWDKKKTYDLAERLNIPCPQTFNPRNADELPSLYSKLPLAIKPAIKENFFYATGAKAWRAETPEELHRMYAKAALQIRPEEILVQQIIPGDGQRQVSYCAFFRDGKAHGVLLARRERQHPREFGRAATYVETIELPIIEELSERFLRAINYYGLVEVEFKQDPRDGEFKLLDVNARTWGFHILGSCAGVDFPYLQFADQMGLSLTDPRGRPGIGWLRWMTDVPAALSEILFGELSVSSYIGSLRRTGIESVFCRQDPLPALAEVALLPYLIVTKYFHFKTPEPKPVEPVSAAPTLDRSSETYSHPCPTGVGPKVHRIDPLDDSRWGTLLQEQPRASVFHSVEWLRAIRRTYGYKPIAFTTSPSDAPLKNGVVFCRIDSWFTGRRLVSVPFSDHCEPLVEELSDLREMTTALAEELHREHFDYIELRPMRDDCDLASLYRSSRSYYFHELSLNPDLDTLFRSCHKDSIQRKIRRAEREGLTYEEGRSPGLLNAFYRLMLITRRRHSIPPQPRAWFYNLADSFGEALKIRIAFKDRQAVAAILTLQHKDVMLYKYGCSDARFNNLGGTHLLFWKTIQEAKRSGLRAFDLGRSDRNNIGLVTFKERWGGTRSELNYLRFAAAPHSKGTFRAAETDWKKQVTQQVIPYVPDRLLSWVGDVAYRHIG